MEWRLCATNGKRGVTKVNGSCATRGDQQRRDVAMGTDGQLGVVDGDREATGVSGCKCGQRVDKVAKGKWLRDNG